MVRRQGRGFHVKTKKQLIDELEAVYRRVEEMEKVEGNGQSTEEALVQREFVKCAAIEEMPDGAMLVDMAGKVVFVNKAFERILGYGAAELVGQSALELPTYRSSKDRDKALEAFKEVIESGSSEHVDIGAVSKDGREVPVSFAASAIRDAQGRPRTLVAVMRDITKRKRAEEALRKSEENYRMLVENSMDISVIVNGDMSIRYVSPSAKSILGWETEELIGANALEYLTPQDVEHVLNLFDQVADNPGLPVSIEVGFRHKDGSWRALEGLANNLLDDPTVKGVVVTSRDITERRQAEEALKQREEHFRALIENSLDGIAILDSDLNIRYESPSAERITGYTLKELVGKTTFDLVHPDDMVRVTKTFGALAKHRAQDAPASVRFLHKDGTWHVIEGVAHNLLHDPNVNGIVVNYRDVTERTRAEEALKQREEHFRILIENSLDDVSILDRDGNILYQSPSIERVLGYAPEGHAGISSLSFLHPDDMKFVSRSFEKLITNPGSSFQGEVRALHRDGTWRTLEVIVRNFLDDPVVEGLLANFRDITERKLAEAERVKHAAALARADELQRSRQRMVAVQESVRRDIAQQIHGSVQNRLIILLHRLTELERAAPPGVVAKEIEGIREKLGELLDTQVRPISHRLYPSILRRGLVAALQSLGDQLEGALAIDMRMSEDLVRRERTNPKSILEQVRLAAYRIAEEALTNAIKHAGASGATIEVVLLPNEQLSLTVRDDGGGFDIQGAPTGLGLQMMRDYAEVVGGSCVIHSLPGEGTEVRANLPVGGPDAGHPETVSSSE